ncbi:MAG: exopolysaccharide transport family protein [Rhizobiaceae bacterium]|nr:exopolysaccharide transport family protein [Rhizobiaceae bacterium]
MASNHNSANDVDVDLGTLFASIARDWRRILIIALVVTAAAFILVSVLTPKYKGETRILIETRESEFTRVDTNSVRSAPILDEEGVASQVEVIASTDIIKKVAAQLNLANVEEFDARPSVLANLLAMAGLATDRSNLAPEERVLKAFREKLEVYRVENSRVIVVEFSSEDPKLAAAVPNAMADAYIAVQRAAKLESNADATQWLEPEIAELREKVKEAEQRVAEFRGKSDLFIGENNSVLATQQLSQLSTELSRVRANRSAAEAKVSTMQAALDGGVSLDTVPDVLASPLIQRLRENELELRAQIAELSTTLLSNHPRIKALNSQVNDLQQQIRSEARKVLTGLQNEARTARAREEALLADVNRLKAESARADEEGVELRALEREAAAQRELLESYLTRYREASSRGERNYLPADARIFSRAIVPAEPYFPKKVPIIGAAFAATLLLMVIATLLLELFSGRAMRPAPNAAMPTVEDVEMPARHASPAMTPAEAARAAARTHEIAESVAETEEEVPAAPVRPLYAPQEMPSQEPENRFGEIDVDEAAAQLISEGTARAVFVSVGVDDGAAAAVLVARDIAESGLRTLLLDLTASGAASRATVESRFLRGVTDLLVGEAQFADVIHPDHFSPLHVMPIGTANLPRAMRAVDRLPIVLDSLNTAYDMVIIDGGPGSAESVGRLMGEDTRAVVSCLWPSDDVGELAEHLAEAGLGEPMIVRPTRIGDVRPGRTAA